MANVWDVVCGLECRIRWERGMPGAPPTVREVIETDTGLVLYAADWDKARRSHVRARTAHKAALAIATADMAAVDSIVDDGDPCDWL